MSDDFIVWEDSYSLGITIIDDQHKKLIGMINNLFQNCKKQDSTAKAAIAVVFKETGDYAQTHFKDEEMLLRQAFYPNLDEHISQHKSFMNEVWDIFSKFNQDNDAPVKLARFLKKWLLTHIAVVDKQYVPYLKK